MSFRRSASTFAAALVLGCLGYFAGLKSSAETMSIPPPGDSAVSSTTTGPTVSANRARTAESQYASMMQYVRQAEAPTPAPGPTIPTWTYVPIAAAIGAGSLLVYRKTRG